MIKRQSPKGRADVSGARLQNSGVPEEKADISGERLWNYKLRKDERT